ncbi:ORAOV1 isoform 2 [Pan troglodytes]|uniref:LTO1 maturation factor of ABCE1 n=3 Tax=Hominidae TaxID=9604 RepID=F5H179_HUMAN|nr:ORAOV1 isoform 2 [Pan troglodytes]PNJ38910.1 ORAOV1 isoform 12 [Pongo abelii]
MAGSQDIFDAIVMADERSGATKVLLLHGNVYCTVAPLRRTAER